MASVVAIAFMSSQDSDEPVHENLVAIASARSQDSDEPAHQPSLARAFPACILKIWKLKEAQTKL